MKNKTVKVIDVVIIIVFTIIGISFSFHVYNMYNEKVKRVNIYEELKDTGVFDGFFEQETQDFFEKSELNRKGEQISSPQQIKKIAKTIFLKKYGLDSVMFYNLFSVYHDYESKMWLVCAEPCIQHFLPFMFGSSYCLLISDDGYTVATFTW